MKKNKKERKSAKSKLIIILIVMVIISIVSLFIMKVKYINMYNKNKYSVLAQTKTIELPLAKEPKQYACIKNLCYSNEFKKVEILNKDFVYDKNCNMYVKKNENSSRGCAGLHQKNYSKINLISANYLDSGPSVYVYELKDTKNMFEYTYGVLNELEKTSYKQSKKEYSKFIRKTEAASINKNKAKISCNFDKFWNFYTNYKYNDVNITDSWFKIRNEYNKLVVYQTFSTVISSDSPYYESHISPEMPSILEIIRIEPEARRIPSSSLQSIYIVKKRSYGLAEATYRVFFGSYYIFEGFYGWSDDEVLSFVQSIKTG